MNKDQPRTNKTETPVPRAANFNINRELIAQVIKYIATNNLMNTGSHFNTTSQAIHQLLIENGFDGKGNIVKRITARELKVIKALYNLGNMKTEEIVVITKLSENLCKGYIKMLNRKSMIIIDRGMFGEYIRLKPLGEAYLIAWKREQRREI